MNHPSAYQLLERFNEIQMENKPVDEKDESDALTISYMLGAENTKDAIRTLKKRIAELEEQKNGAYSERNKILVGLCSMAIALDYPVYIMPHDGENWDADWRNIVVIEGPTGQMTWHIHDSEMNLFEGLPKTDINKWDGHDTEEKYRRVVGLNECCHIMGRNLEAQNKPGWQQRIDKMPQSTARHNLETQNKFLISVIDDVLHELAVESPLSDIHWEQVKERLRQAAYGVTPAAEANNSKNETWGEYESASFFECAGVYNDLAKDIVADNGVWFDEFIKLCKRYYENWPTGGTLHIILDDGNINDDHVSWCVGYAHGLRDGQAGDIANLMSLMTKKQRRKVVGSYNLYA